MSYKVLRDGNGSGLIRVIGLGDYMPLKDHQAMVTECEEKSKAIFDIMAERDALAAQVGILHEIYHLADGARVEHSEGNAGEEKKWLNKLYSVAGDYMQSKSQQCLAEIKAEAGRAGYLACLQYVGGVRGSFDEDLADKYADKIRNTGTWLKDSNVNGGKRQGGAE